MKITRLFVVAGATALLLLSCVESSTKENIDSAKEPQETIWVEMLVEIPSGTVKKFEFDKQRKILVQDSVNGMLRVINYLGYPGNYGMIPNTLLPYDLGGDGDPLDIIAIGPPEKAGSLINCKVIGVLKLKDKGEQDDKLIAISENSSLIKVETLEELNKNYPGISTIIETWFLNYKGQGKMQSEGFHSKARAQEILSKAKTNKN